MRKITCNSTLKPHIRPARKEDLSALVDLENICFKEETFHKEQLEYLLIRAKSLVLVASIEDSIVGSIIVLLRNHIASARIYSLNVHPEHRRKGLASLLMDTCEKLLIEKGFKKITLEVGVNNNAARNLYYLKGFSVDKKLRNYYKNGDDALHLIKRL